MKALRCHSLSRLAIFGLLLGSLNPLTRAQDSVCARVTIQIDQELTLEREGFEARLGIANGQPSSLDEFQVTLRFTDADGNAVRVATDAAPDPEALFYYRVQTGSTVPASIAAGAAQKVAYLIVPAPGAAGSASEGNLYYIGATVKYTVAGVQQTVEIAPDFIHVRPMPQLQLQYFLPGDVYGDDPMTSDVQEPVVPFPLGVRVTNHSASAAAHSLRIQSGQPEIIDNRLGLLVDFRILGCAVNGAPAQPSLLVDFGDVAPQRAAMGDWLMSCSLSGRFVKFTAEITHAPEFGGALTSLIPEDAISTHRLLGQVVVDLPGRDAIPDFLGCDAMTGDPSAPRLYESDNDQVDQPVDYFAPGNAAVAVTAEGGSATLSLDAASVLLYVRTASPISADKLVRAVRSDGKVLPAANCWVSKNKDSNLQWVYWLNLFDTGKQAGQTYALTFTDLPSANRPPVLTIISGPAFRFAAGRPCAIGVFGVDPDGTIPVLTTGLLPDGAGFTDRGDGRGSFRWTPRSDQLGAYAVQFRASDGLATDSKSAQVQVLATVPATFKDWQQRYWPDTDDPAIVGPDADPDGDRINNLLEYALDADPTVADDALLPEIGLETVDGQRYLTLTYRRRTDDPALNYEVVASDNLFAPLASWTVQSQTLTVGQEDLPAAMERIKVRDSVPVASGPLHRYLRLRVTHSDN
ncbi:MAG: hypothetical protein PHE83_04165 [Opitutaceae bacterium]|nr:hypothetical protein [Opitutaceae bacterium]